MSDVSVTSFNSTNALGFTSVVWSKNKNTVQSSQPSISAYMENSVQSDIHGNNNSQLHMAIYDFFHYDNIQDRSFESHRFATLLAKSQLVGNDFKCANRRQTGGELLDHN